MKKNLLLLFCITLNFAFSQGGWIKDDNPLNEVVNYKTTFSFVGVSFVDLNGDQFTDLYLSPSTLFINNGNGTFKK